MTTKELCDHLSLEERRNLFICAFDWAVSTHQAMCTSLKSAIRRSILNFSNIDDWQCRNGITECTIDGLSDTRFEHSAYLTYHNLLEEMINYIYPNLSRRFVEDWLKCNERPYSGNCIHWFKTHADRIDFMNYYMDTYLR